MPAGGVDEDMCCVCLESLDPAHTASITGCSHKIHMDCLTAMCTFQGNVTTAAPAAAAASNIMRCPLCRCVFSSFQLSDGTVIDVDIPAPAASIGAAMLGPAVVVARVSAPTFSPSTSRVPWGTLVTLTSSTPGAAIYYSTDIVDLVSARQFRLHRYRAPIRVRGMRSCIRALAVKDGMMHSTLTTMFCETTICAVRLARCSIIIPAVITLGVAIMFIAVLVRL